MGMATHTLQVQSSETDFGNLDTKFWKLGNKILETRKQNFQTRKQNFRNLETKLDIVYLNHPGKQIDRGCDSVFLLLFLALAITYTFGVSEMGMFCYYKKLFG